MTRSLPLLLIAVGGLVVQAGAQVLLDEAGTRATLVQDRTAISITVENKRTETLDATVQLQWLDPNGVVLSSIRQRSSITPGSSRIPIALPLPAKSEADARMLRLRYEVIPGPRNYGSFAYCSGILNLVNIAPYAFSLQVFGTPEAHPGLPFELQVLASHPATGEPAANVQVHAGDATATTDQHGVAVLRPKLPADYDGDEISVSGNLGDFRQTVKISAFDTAHVDIRVGVDKPLYQPGQTMHVRTLARGPDGRALAGTEQRVRILDASGNLAHTASVTSSRFGIAWTDWLIPSNSKAGKFTIEVRSDKFEGEFDRDVDVRPYELPSFRVSAKSSSPYYLAGQQASASVRAEYLFGKPIVHGHLRILQGSQVKAEWSGDLDDAGFAQATLSPGQVTIPKGENFTDAHYTAFVTDPSTNRTEQRAFDIRFSRGNLHLYITRREETLEGERLYLATYLPDGTPAQSVVHVSTGVSCTTNRLGVCGLEVPSGEEQVTLYATTHSGERSNSVNENPHEPATLVLQTDHALYRKGAAVRCHLAARDKRANVFLLAWNTRQQIVFSRMLTLANGAADVELPYDQRFADHLFIMAAELGRHPTSTTEVLFPGALPFQVSITPAKPSYRPGDVAQLNVHTSSPGALGIAVVDQSVFERARTDAPSASSGFELPTGLNSVGGVSQDDLLRLEPSKITEELQLVARALVSPPPAFAETETWQEAIISAFADPQRKALASIKGELDAILVKTLEYPRDEQTFSAIALRGPADPWGEPYYPAFSTEGRDHVLCLNSSGPDKRRHSDDDFCALEVRRPWFALYTTLIQKALARTVDFPESRAEFERQVQSTGLLFSALRDPWDHPLAVQISYEGAKRQIQIKSSGPDGKWNSADDVLVDTFSGTYFAQTEESLRKILDGVKPHPTSSGEVLTGLDAAGFRFGALRDRWGHPLAVNVDVDEQFTDKIAFYSYAEYGHRPEQREKITPTKLRRSIIQIRSAGPDGVSDTPDDFTLATFTYLLEDSVPPARGTQARIEVPGSGVITGVVRDPSGAVISGAVVHSNGIHIATSASNGVYICTGVRPGVYELQFGSPGFQVLRLAGIPVLADRVTSADAVLQVGSVAQSVEVSASPAPLNTAAAMLASKLRTNISTPHLREYFPETLYWRPEVLTDAQGNASIEVKLADTITTWKVNLIASTVQGDISESSSEIRAFQPFQVDLDVPRTLTEGDRVALSVPVRNYLERTQNIRVVATANGGLTSTLAVVQPGPIAPSSSANILLNLRASSVNPAAKVKVSALGDDASDSIEKTIAVHPDGQWFEHSASDVIRKSGELDLTLPAQALPGSVHGELRIYPSLVSRIVEAMEVLLERPSGCGEQTISAAYTNLLFLRALKQAGIQNQQLQSKALRNLQLGYDRLLAYQAASGAFTYWGKDDADTALTAYALEFLRDAGDFIRVDDDHFKKAQDWLAAQKPGDQQLQTWQLRGLLTSHSPAGFGLERRLAELARAAGRFTDPYAVAQFASATIDAGKPELARDSIRMLVAGAQPDHGAAFWSLAANTPFHGWGHSGQVETTGVVVAALARWNKRQPKDTAASDVLNRGVLYLLRNTSAGGAWPSSQSTVQALLALLESWQQYGSAKLSSRFTIHVNGVVAGDLVTASAHSEEPLTIDLSTFLRAGETNHILVTTSSGDQLVQAQFDATWYQQWQGDRSAPDLAVQTQFDRLEVAVNDAITCQVKVSRPGFRGYGMLIARIGLPPGSEVDRGTLAAVVADRKASVDYFEVSPDAVTFYLWPRAADNTFSFVFRPRFVMNAKSSDSVIYDYYNPEDRTVLAPQTFVVRQSR